VLRTTNPLVPDEPAFSVLNISEPLEVLEPRPDVIDTRPPVELEDKPALKMSSPPVPLFPEPIAM
jgi:hypothetical protein